MNDLPPADSFIARLDAARRTSGSALCVGLDPDSALLPDGLHGVDGLETFCRAVIESTADLVCAYKPNLAFFERFGADGWRALERVIAAVPRHIPVIADAKRGDIGSTSAAYAEALFDRLGVAACTASPYLGADAIAPLLDHPRGYVYVLCRTSNPGAGALQDLLVEGTPLYARVIALFEPWLAVGRAGLVIGAQEAAAFERAASLAPGVSLLVPGIGAQGGTVDALATALSRDQRDRVVVNVSRAIIHAGRDRAYPIAVRDAAYSYRDALRRGLQLSTAGVVEAAGRVSDHSPGA